MYFITSKPKRNSYLVCSPSGCSFRLTLVVTSLKNSAFKLLRELHPSLSYCLFSAFSRLRRVSAFKYLRACNHDCQVLSLLCAHAIAHAGARINMQCEAEMRHKCQMGEMAAITLITLLSENSIHVGSLFLPLPLWRYIYCGSVLFLRAKESDLRKEHCFCHF